MTVDLKRTRTDVRFARTKIDRARHESLRDHAPPEVGAALLKILVALDEADTLLTRLLEGLPLVHIFGDRS